MLYVCVPIMDYKQVIRAEAQRKVRFGKFYQNNSTACTLVDHIHLKNLTISRVSHVLYDPSTWSLFKVEIAFTQAMFQSCLYSALEAKFIAVEN